MDDVTVILTALVGGGCLLLVRYLWRRLWAAKLADQLLNDVVKAKDAFRR